MRLRSRYFFPAVGFLDVGVFLADGAVFFISVFASPPVLEGFEAGEGFAATVAAGFTAAFLTFLLLTLLADFF